MIRYCILFLLLLCHLPYLTKVNAQDTSFLSLEARIESDTVVVQVKGIQFKDVLTTQFGILFPTQNLNFVRGISQPFFSEAAIGGNPSNCLFSWMPSPSNPVTLQNFDEIVELRFYIHTPASEYCFDFDKSLFPLRISSVSQNPHPSRGIPFCQSGLKGRVSGLIQTDMDGDCVADPNTPPVAFVGIIFQEQSGIKHHVFTKPDGSFSVDLPFGDYTYQFSDPGFREYCNAPGALTVNSPSQPIFISQTAKNLVDCAELEVQLTTPGLRRCDDVVFDLSYKNLGTSDAIDVFIDLQINEQLILLEADLPFSNLGNNKFRFLLDTLKSAEKGLFQFKVSTPCDVALLGNSMCLAAEIFPNSPCLTSPAYDGAKLEIQSSCVGNEAVFQIKNVGSGDMSQPVDFTTVEDDVMPGIGGQILLLKDATREIRIPSSGQTWRIVLDTLPNHPYQIRYTKALEACGAGTASKGFVNNYSQADEAPQFSVHCGELLDQIALKAALPEGMGPLNIIFKDNRIYYTTRMINQLADTGFILQIKEKLSEHLDLSSLIMYDSKLPFSWSVDSNHELNVEFKNIQIPPQQFDSVTSVVYLSYSIKPKTDLDLQTEIQNYSEYRFNFGDVQTSNTYTHHLGEWLINATNNPELSENIILVYPNPFSDGLIFKATENQVADFTLVVYNIFGQELISQKSTGDVIHWKDTKQLPEGFYFYKIMSKMHVIQSGQIVKNN
ncbi:MAG: T9SS type A sorting domain-containing protein [Saprospiraceae bacterium]|nr:T9SS type A sorting domain-containing protein [Saprospiraceae bacterium]MBK9630384.1 T9SS type A sorting domain-containing protein [Saprospiraceae bacterium]